MSDTPIPHEWKQDEEGHIENFEYGDYHDGPQCVRCKMIFCRDCDAKEMAGPCSNQTPALFDIYPPPPAVTPGPKSAARKQEIAFRRSFRITPP